MRISDWSSDVCSSDLASPAFSIDPNQVLNVPQLPGQEATTRVKSTLSDGDLGPIRQRAGQVSRPRAALPVDKRHGSSEERRVGKAVVSTCRSRWSPDH